MNEPTASGRPKKRRRGPRFWLVIAGLVLLGNPCTLALGIRIAAVEAFEIDGPSSAPAFQSGDRVFVDKTAYGLFLPFASEASATWGAPALGDVVIARSPYDDIDTLKRVVGLPGDTIAIEENVLVRNGNPLARVPLGPAESANEAISCFRETLGDVAYVVLQHDDQAPDQLDPVAVPAGHVYLLGDHRERSADSRLFGPVPIARLKGRVASHYYVAPNRLRCPGG